MRIGMHTRVRPLPAERQVETEDGRVLRPRPVFGLMDRPCMRTGGLLSAASQTREGVQCC